MVRLSNFYTKQICAPCSLESLHLLDHASKGPEGDCLVSLCTMASLTRLKFTSKMLHGCKGTSRTEFLFGFLSLRNRHTPSASARWSVNCPHMAAKCPLIMQLLKLTKTLHHASNASHLVFWGSLAYSFPEPWTLRVPWISTCFLAVHFDSNEHTKWLYSKRDGFQMGFDQLSGII